MIYNQPQVAYPARKCPFPPAQRLLSAAFLCPPGANIKNNLVVSNAASLPCEICCMQSTVACERITTFNDNFLIVYMAHIGPQCVWTEN